MNLTDLERRHFRRQFSMTLCNLDQVEMYWSPSDRRIIARATSSIRHFFLPRDALLIGSYAPPFDSNDFLGDLDDLIAKLYISTTNRADRAARAG